MHTRHSGYSRASAALRCGQQDANENIHDLLELSHRLLLVLDTSEISVIDIDEPILDRDVV